MISTTITKHYFNLKMADLEESGYFLEFKEQKPFWDKRLEKYNSNRNLNIPIVFLVGNKPYWFKVVSVFEVHRDFIPQRYVEAISTEFAWVIKCVGCDNP